MPPVTKRRVLPVTSQSCVGSAVSLWPLGSSPAQWNERPTPSKPSPWSLIKHKEKHNCHLFVFLNTGKSDWSHNTIWHNFYNRGTLAQILFFQYGIEINRIRSEYHESRYFTCLFHIRSKKIYILGSITCDFRDQIKLVGFGKYDHTRPKNASGLQRLWFLIIYLSTTLHPLTYVLWLNWIHIVRV